MDDGWRMSELLDTRTLSQTRMRPDLKVCPKEATGNSQLDAENRREGGRRCFGRFRRLNQSTSKRSDDDPEVQVYDVQVPQTMWTFGGSLK